MVVLLIGGSGVLINAIIDKLNKNGHRVYLLTGKREDHSSYRHVFEKYDFPYDSGSIKDILESIKPDVTIFTGTYDTNFDWNSARQEAVRYMAGLMNILAACSMMKKGRFLYLSSHEVFGASYVDAVKEEETTTPEGFRAMALAQGEETCANYRRTQGMETIILRFDHLYWMPEKGGREDNPCFRMCLEALRSGKISINEKRAFSMIYLNDAVEQAYKIICAESPKQSCYHISSMEEIGEKKLAELVQEEMGFPIEIVNSTVGMNNRLILDSRRYIREFGQKIFNGYDAGVKKVAQYMKHHSNSFLTEDDGGAGIAAKAWNNTRKIFKALFPFVENLICFIVFFFLNRTASESEFFARLDFYLLYVLLFAIVYGQQQAIFSGFLAVVGYCVQEMQIRSGFEIMLDYNTYVWMAQLFIVGLAVGYMKDQLRFINNENSAKIAFLNNQLKDIADINDSNVRMKQNFETQVVNHKDSLGKIYEISATLEQYGPEEVLFYAAQVLSKLMDCGNVAVYTVANGDYARLFSATSPEARKLGNSIKYTDMKELYGEIKERRVYINKNMADKMPMMASAVYSEDNMQLILMLWGIPWERMTLGEANRLTIIGYLIQNAVVRANRYLEALRTRRYVEGTNVLDEGAFTHLAKAFFDAREKGLTEYVLLEILTGGQHYEDVARTLCGSIRQTDYMGILRERQLYVLLSNTNRENAGGIMGRFKNAGYDSRIEEGFLL